MKSHEIVAAKMGVEAPKTCFEKHDKEETKDMEGALKEMLCDLTEARELLVSQNRELSEVTEQLQLEATDGQTLPRDIMQEIVKEKGRILNTLDIGQNNLDECLTWYKKFLQEATSNAKQAKERIAEVMIWNKKMLHLATEFLSIWQNVHVLVKEQNEKVMDKINDLLNESREAAQMVGSESLSTKGPRSTQKPVRSTLQEAEREEKPEKGKVQPAGRVGPKIECHVCHPFSICFIIFSILFACFIYKTMNPHQVIYPRESKVSLMTLSPEYQLEVTQFRSECSKLTFHNNNLWCISTQDNSIDVCNVAGLPVDIIRYEGNINPRSLQPLSLDHMVLAASSGLYLTKSKDGSVYTKLHGGLVYDVHASQDFIVVLLEVESSSEVHIYNKTEPPTLFASFPTKADHTQSLLVHDQHIYVSAWGQNTAILKYNLKGEPVAYYGSKGDGGPGELVIPRLCAVDSDGNLLIADTGNNRFQVLSSLGKFTVVNGMYLEQPYDTVITGEDMFVLHVSRDNKRRVVKYKL